MLKETEMTWDLNSLGPGGCFFFPVLLPCKSSLWLYSEGASLPFHSSPSSQGVSIEGLGFIPEPLLEGSEVSATWHCVDRCLMAWCCGGFVGQDQPWLEKQQIRQKSNQPAFLP